MSDKKVSTIKRVPLDKQNLLMADKRPGFKSMWVNEVPGAVDAYILAGWEPRIDRSKQTQTHDNLSQIESQMDSVCRRVVNKGINAPCRTAILMDIPLDLYEEDKLAALKESEEKERAFKVNKHNEYGSVENTINRF